MTYTIDMVDMVEPNINKILVKYKNKFLTRCKNKFLLLSILSIFILINASTIVMAEDAQGNVTGQSNVTAQQNAITTQQSTPVKEGKFRAGPTVRIKPLNDNINKSADGIVELYFDNPSLNDIPLTVDARISVPAGIHVYGQGFALADAAGMVYGIFEVPPGSVRTIYVNIKAEKTGNFYTQFSGLYYPGQNKDNYQPISLTYPFTVYEPSIDPKNKKLTNPEQIPESARPSDFMDKIIPGIIITLVAGLVGLIYKIYEIRYAHRLQMESKTTKIRTTEGTITESETTETKTTEEKK